LLNSPDLHTPGFEDTELDAMLERTKARSDTLRARHARRRSIAALVAVVLVAAVVATSVLTLQQGGPAPQWKFVGYISSSWQLQSAGGSEGNVDLTCPTTSTCYAVNINSLADQIEVTRDGGTTWQRAHLPERIIQIAAGPSCATRASCSVLGDAESGGAFFLTTNDYGQTWKSIRAPEVMSVPPLTSSSYTGFYPTISCTSRSACVVVGFETLPVGEPRQGVAFVTTDGGHSWSKSQMPSGFVPTYLQCFSDGGCVSAGFEHFTIPSAPAAVAYSTDGGVIWSSSVIPEGSKGFRDLSCSDASDCVASASRGSRSLVYVSTNGGQTWSPQVGSGFPRKWVGGIAACVSNSHCWFSGGVFRGRPTVEIENTTGLIASTTDGGRSWQRAHLPVGVQFVGGLSCPDSSTCFALAYKTFGPAGSIGLLSYRR
jgi:photosystem II stability/assembly factor-like uncharacterized protein